MKSLLLAIIALTFLNASYVLAESPYPPQIDERLDSLESITTFTGDISVTSAGVASIAAGVIVNADIAMSVISTDKVQTYGADGRLLKQVARATWNPSRYDSQGAAGDHGLSTYIPAYAIITDAYGYVARPVEGSGSKVGFYCGNKFNIFNVANITALGQSTVFATDRADSTISPGVANHMLYGQSTACDISATVETAKADEGEIILFVEYVIAR